MKAVKISIKNFMGIDNLEFAPGKVTLISGRNGEGKSSVIEAIKKTFKAKSDVKLIHNGSDKAEILLEFDDNSSLYRTIKSDKTTLEASKGGLGINKPQTWLDHQPIEKRVGFMRRAELDQLVTQSGNDRH